ncbi:hypothetical protein [Bacteroides uniformis]|uniref:hypothetical protein n=1 Tax=Bacteroides uniformis TaxID=820 RepID=UPI0039B38E6D
MTPYVIFVIVLTVAYIIYYGYHISKDLYGKKNEEDTPVEEFDVSGMQDEVIATPVRESGDGFSLGEETVRGSGNPGRAEPEGEASAGNGKGRFDDLTENMDETDVTSEGGVPYDELEQMLYDKKPDIAFRKSTVSHTRETY